MHRSSGISAARCLRLGLTFAKNNIREFFVIKPSIAIGIIDLEVLLKVTIFDDNSHFSYSLLEGRIFDLSRSGEVEEFKRFYQKSLFILIC
jgi:hypothetical protein